MDERNRGSVAAKSAFNKTRRLVSRKKKKKEKKLNKKRKKEKKRSLASKDKLDHQLPKTLDPTTPLHTITKKEKKKKKFFHSFPILTVNRILFLHNPSLLLSLSSFVSVVFFILPLFLSQKKNPLKKRKKTNQDHKSIITHQ